MQTIIHNKGGLNPALKRNITQQAFQKEGSGTKIYWFYDREKVLQVKTGEP
jgi:hypothetical protein